jgi:hypothetical protein
MSNDSNSGDEHRDGTDHETNVERSMVQIGGEAVDGYIAERDGVEGVGPDEERAVMALDKKTDDELVTDGGTPATGARHEPATRGEIALHQLEYLKEHPGVCVQVSFSAGNHPYYRWNGEAFERAERMGYGELEVQTVGEDTLVRHFAENPVELMPLDEPDYSPVEGGRANVWDRVDEGGDGVTRHA